MSGVTLRPLAAADVRVAATLHRSAFPGFFLSTLGEPFLRLFYAGYLSDDSAVALVAEADGAVVGVVVGSTQPVGFFRRLLLRRWLAFGLASLGIVLRSPRRLPRLLRAVTYRGHIPVQVEGALLSSICAHPNGPSGTGRALIAGFTDELLARGTHAAYLTTDVDDNDRVHRFYEAAGWRPAGDFATPEGRRMRCYTWAAPRV